MNATTASCFTMRTWMLPAGEERARIRCCFGHGMTPPQAHICRYCEWTSPMGAVLRTGAAVYCTTGQAALGPLLATAS